MGRCEAKRSERGSVGAQFIGDDSGRCEALLLEQLEHEFLGHLGVSLGLNQKIEHLALVVDFTPWPVPPAVDHHGHLVEVPVIARLRRCASQVGGDCRAELQKPAPDRFVGDVNAALGQHLLDVTK